MLTVISTATTTLTDNTTADVFVIVLRTVNENENGESGTDGRKTWMIGAWSIFVIVIEYGTVHGRVKKDGCLVWYGQDKH